MSGKNYNHLYLWGDTHITDERYCEMLELDPALAGTPEINNKFLEENPDKELTLKRKLASMGLQQWDL